MKHLKQIGFTVMMTVFVALAEAVPTLTDFEKAVYTDDVTQRLSVAFGKAPCTLTFHFRVDRFPNEGDGLWTSVSPMTLMRLESKLLGEPALLVRLSKRKVMVTLFKPGGRANFDVTSDAVLGEKMWHQVALTDSGKEMNLYLDGEPIGYHWHSEPLPSFSRAQVGADGRQRVFQGAIGKPIVSMDQCLSDDEVATRYRKMTPEVVQRVAKNGSVLPEYDADTTSVRPYHALQVVREELHPLIDQLSVSATTVAWCDAKGRDLLAFGGGAFGSRLALYRFTEMRNGLPVYDNGTTVTALPCERYQALPNTRGTFDLFARGTRSRFGQGSFVQYVNTGTLGKPVFKVRQVCFDGKPMALALVGLTAWALADINRDGTEDFIYMRTLASGGDTKFPFEGSPWTGKKQRYAGRGKGYDIRGAWLGNEVIGEVYWVPGRRGTDGNVNFGIHRQVQTDVKDYPLLWKTIGAARAVTLQRLEGKDYLLLAGNIDELMALEVAFRDGEIFCSAARPLLKSGYMIPHTYLVSRISATDLDGDGTPELLLDGNPGVVAVLKGRRVGEFESVGVVQTRGGSLSSETLISPCRFDWDGNGSPDLLTGDASGQLLLWPGTADTWTYHAPLTMTVDGLPVKPVAGMSGSIQGPNEKRWGYLKVVAGLWGGEKAVITDDITGQLVRYRSAGRGGTLKRGKVFTLRGEPFKVAWRSRPDIVLGTTGFLGVSHDVLLIQDWDGDLAIAVPSVPGGTDFCEVIKLCYTDGGNIQLCGPSGLWGRGAMMLTDWDRDGNLDLIFGTNRSCQQFFSEEMKQCDATPFLLKNEGTNHQPRFARPVPLKLKSGVPLRFGVHNATPWITDLDGDGQCDLLVGAEDGKVYGFLRGEFID